MSLIKSSLTKRRTDARGFTLVELMVSMAVVGVVGLVMLSVMVSTMKLSSVNASTNISNYRTRQTLDRLAEIVHYGLDTPVLINSSGVTQTGTADGLLVKNLLGGSYVFLNASGKTTDDIPTGTSSFTVQYAASAGADVPKVGDYFLLASSTAPELEVKTVGSVTTSNGISSVAITTQTAVQETLATSIYTVTASRYRKEAFVFVQNGNYWTLRHYGRVIASTNYALAVNYVTMGTGFEKQGTQAWFTTTTDNGTQATWLRALVRSSNHNEYAEHVDGRNTATTMPLQVKLWNYNAPPAAN